MYNVFIDGKEGTTGLKIFERFAKRNDIQIITIDDEKRKDPAEKQKCINASDFTFLCLPDAAAIESAQLCTNPNTKIIDASTAHRTNPDWAYGFPELSKEFRSKIQSSNRVAVPGCYASGFNSLCYPMRKSGFMNADYPVVCHAVSGYSGAGKKAIAVYESSEKPVEFESPRMYALTQGHKHLPEMKKVSMLDFEPVFDPYVCDYFSGMTVTIPIFTRLLSKNVSAKDIHSMFEEHYADSHFVKVMPFQGEGILETPFIPANTLSGTNNMRIYITGNDDRVILTSQFDNLGKGASGAAVQCMNIMMGIDESISLESGGASFRT